MYERYTHIHHILHSVYTIYIGTPEQMKTRGQSQYINKTFIQIIQEELLYLSNNNINTNTTYTTFQQNILHKLPMSHGGHSILVRGLYALQLEPWLQHSTRAVKSATGHNSDPPSTTNNVLDIKIVDITQLKNTPIIPPQIDGTGTVINNLQETMNDIYEYIGAFIYIYCITCFVYACVVIYMHIILIDSIYTSLTYRHNE